MELTREFRITIEVYRDTNKATYRDQVEFDSYGAALKWLRDQYQPRDEMSADG